MPPNKPLSDSARASARGRRNRDAPVAWSIAWDDFVRTPGDRRGAGLIDPRLADAAQRSLQLVQSCTDAIIAMSPLGLVVGWNPAAERMFGIASQKAVGASAFELFPHLAQDHLPYLIGEAVDHGNGASIESTGLDLGSGLPATVCISASPIVDGDNVIGVALLGRDISAAAALRAHQAALVQEANHRIKNTLAVVHSIAAQMLHFYPEAGAFEAQFFPRLAALSQVQTLSIDVPGGAPLRELLEAQTAPFCGEDNRRCLLHGPEIRLNARAALAIGMAVHELATNAAKYGGLSTAGGCVDITWVVTRRRGERYLRLSWREAGGPPVVSPSRRGFGSVLIERGLPLEFGGEAKLYFDQSGARYVCYAPLASLEAST